MIKKLLSVFFSCLLMFAANFQTILAQSTTSNSNERISIEKIKTDVYRRGTGEKSKVVVKTKDGKKMKGFISQAGEDSFTVTDSKSKQTTLFAYGDVTRVKKPGLSTGAKIAIFGGIAAAVTVVVLAIAVKDALDDLGPISICC
jgi:hypothetical protein